MAETKAKAAKTKPKKAKAAATKKPPAKTAVKKAAPAPKGRAKAKAKRPAAKASAFRPKTSTFNVAELMDHPLIADLLAVGALAAVGAIADHTVKARTGQSASGSTRAVKAAGKAAAAAVGKRLMTEFDAIKQGSAGKNPKRGPR